MVAQALADNDTALDEVVLALSILDGQPATAEHALALASCGLTLTYARLFPLAAEVLEAALATAEQVGMPTGRFHAQAQYVHLTWGMSLDHLGLIEECRRRWADVERHYELANADPATVPDLMLALSSGERALLAARLGDPTTARRHVAAARANGLGKSAR